MTLEAEATAVAARIVALEASVGITTQPRTSTSAAPTDAAAPGAPTDASSGAQSVVAAALAVAALLAIAVAVMYRMLRALEGRMAMATLGGGTTTRRPSAPVGSAAQTVRPGAAHHMYTRNPALDADGYVSSAEVAASGVSLDAEGYVSSAELASGV